MQNGVCCFIGHRTINETNELKIQLFKIIENLIVKENVGVFLFGSKSQFNDLCYEVVSKVKEKHTHIKRIYVRAEFSQINDIYKEYLLKSYEYTYYSNTAFGKSAYVQRNRDMINNSDFCVIYYNQSQFPQKRKSGTKIALDYAIKIGKKIIILND